MANALWGFPFSETELGNGTFDELFGACERAFKHRLRTDATRSVTGEYEKRSIPYLVNRSPNVADDSVRNETQLHYLLKAFVIRSLVECGECSLEEVATEGDTEIATATGGSLIPDVQAGRTVYEVETLYGTGEPLTKLKETVERYHQSSESPGINLVLTGLTAGLYAYELRQLIRDIDAEYPALTVNILVPSLHDRTLVSFDEMDNNSTPRS
ncbi:hypothetical protein ACFPYI_21730 [Halomarina salina]|uniref:Uncharacterized protein n=1 Tax=Halomarina salina TaxID=1872699 RepID=A0ABD5RUY8_9EURY|nr:hypothetical protein [Halomarina salina]